MTDAVNLAVAVGALLDRLGVLYAVGGSVAAHWNGLINRGGKCSNASHDISASRLMRSGWAAAAT